MGLKRFKFKSSLKFVIAILFLGIAIFSFIYFPSAQMINPGDFGAVSFVASLPNDNDKLAIIAKIKKAGFGWVREEYTYTLPMNYVPFDNAYQKILEGNLKILGLLTYPGPDKSHEIWKEYVTETVGRYPEAAAWEIMNEADNYLSAADYTVYLKEASEIIRDKSPAAKIIATGITSRVGDNQFWDGIASAGGWGAFDGVGLHIYHEGDPYEDSNDNGTFYQEIQKAVASIRQNGADKTIWITEFGYDSNKYGEDDQADWLVESFSIMKTMPEVERAFVYRVYEHEDGLGLLDIDFKEKDAFSAVKTWFDQGAPPTKQSLIPPAIGGEAAPPKAQIDSAKSLIRLDGENISPDGQEQFRLVVGLKDAGGKAIKDQKPVLALTDKSIIQTDFTLVGDEWFAYIASTEAGEKSAQIKVAETDLGEVKMVFGVTDLQIVSEAPSPQEVIEVPSTNQSNQILTPDPVASSSVAQPQTVLVKHSRSGLIWFSGIETVIILLIIMMIFKLWKRHRLPNQI